MRSPYYYFSTVTFSCWDLYSFLNNSYEQISYFFIYAKFNLLIVFVFSVNKIGSRKSMKPLRNTAANCVHYRSKMLSKIHDAE